MMEKSYNIENVKEKWKEEEEEQGSRKRSYQKEKASTLNPKTLNRMLGFQFA